MNVPDELTDITTTAAELRHLAEQIRDEAKDWRDEQGEGGYLVQPAEAVVTAADNLCSVAWKGVERYHEDDDASKIVPAYAPPVVHAYNGQRHETLRKHAAAIALLAPDSIKAESRAALARYMEGDTLPLRNYIGGNTGICVEEIPRVLRNLAEDIMHTTARKTASHPNLWRKMLPPAVLLDELTKQANH